MHQMHGLLRSMLWQKVCPKFNGWVRCSLAMEQEQTILYQDSARAGIAPNYVVDGGVACALVPAKG